jgi:hypothetical protein
MAVSFNQLKSLCFWQQKNKEIKMGNFSRDTFGIKLPGNTHNHVQNPNIILGDISFTAGSENNYWQKAVNIINAFDPLLENIFARFRNWKQSQNSNFQNSKQKQHLTFLRF